MDALPLSAEATPRCHAAVKPVKVDRGAVVPSHLDVGARRD